MGARSNRPTAFSAPMVANALPTATTNPTRAFGRFELRRLLGKSAATMAWLAHDPRTGREAILTLPRMQPVDANALARWLSDARLAARLDHPHLARVSEVGAHEHWPYIAVERGHGVTLGEWLEAHPSPQAAEAVEWICDLLHGLAFVHEAGLVHGDLQLHNLLISDRGVVAVVGLGAAGDGGRAAREAARALSNDRTLALDPGELRAQRAAAVRDVLATGVLLHHLLTGQAPLDEADTARVIDRIAPIGREFLRLPWSTPTPIPEALRAIANRCTSTQERLRYQSARTLLGALTGWLESQSGDSGGPVGLLIDRLHTVGHLPALPGLAARVARVTSLEGQRTDEIADQVLDDMALSFELLRTLNSAQVQGTQVQGNGPVLTLRRIISLIGVNGVRLAANTLRGWPGPLNPAQAHALQGALDRARLAGHTAQALRPRGYDAQVVYLIAVLQNLGRLMLHYHFAEEAEQIAHLIKGGPAARDGEPESPGLSEAAAAFAVLGVEVEALGTAVGRHWGLGEDVMHMVRRLPATATVRKPDTDADVLRLTASAANEAVDALSAQPGARLGIALAQVAQRYARALGINARDVGDAVQAARDTLRDGPPPAVARSDDRLVEGEASAASEATPVAR
jgi:HD-like signal output (HDOD) protein